MASKSASVPVWVRNCMCVVAAVTVPGMLFASCLGAKLETGTTSAIGFFAVYSVCLAFRPGAVNGG